MTKHVPDKAEIALEYPEKRYIGTFEQTSYFDAHFDRFGASLSIGEPGAVDVRKSVHMHFQYGLLAEILVDLARSVTPACPLDADQRDALRASARTLYDALDRCGRRTPTRTDREELTPDEAVRLLHILE